MRAKRADTQFVFLYSNTFRLSLKQGSCKQKLLPDSFPRGNPENSKFLERSSCGFSTKTRSLTAAPVKFIKKKKDLKKTVIIQLATLGHDFTRHPKTESLPLAIPHSKGRGKLPIPLSWCQWPSHSYTIKELYSIAEYDLAVTPHIVCAYYKNLARKVIRGFVSYRAGMNMHGGGWNFHGYQTADSSGPNHTSDASQKAYGAAAFDWHQKRYGFWTSLESPLKSRIFRGIFNSDKKWKFNHHCTILHEYLAVARHPRITLQPKFL
ncbi:hypothetical protein TNCV_1516351 [Trichonephila clavipes]|nr:hypothetical protein TNCV_1516351 [Trichonephila clavipes]